MAATDVRPKITLACAGVQEPQLPHPQEPAERPRPARDEEVLPEATTGTRCTARPVINRRASRRERGGSWRWTGNFVGRSYPPSAVYEVGREKIASSPPRSVTTTPSTGTPRPPGRAGHPDVIAPPTFAIVVSLDAADRRAERPRVGLDYSRVVHGEQRFTHHRPGQRGRPARRQDDDRHHPERRPATTCSPPAVELATEDGEAVVTATSMLVAAGRRREPCASARDDVEVGTELPGRSSRVTRADLVRYAGASGDFNPIHWNERFATAVGLPGVIAHGMFTMAVAVPSVTDWAGDPGAIEEYQRPLRPAGRRPRRRRRCRGDRPRQGRRHARGRPGPGRPRRRQRRREGAVAGPGDRPPGMTAAAAGRLAAAAALLLPGCTSFADTAPRRPRAAPTTAAEPPLDADGDGAPTCARSPIPTGRWSPSTSASPTTWSP